MAKNPKKSEKSSISSSLNSPKQGPSNSEGGGRITCKYVKHQKILLKNHHEFNEKWVQERIAEDPTILGLGELILKRLSQV